MELKEELCENLAMNFKDELFIWQNYLDAKKSKEAPNILFSHVETTLQSGIKIGMALEVPYVASEPEEKSYWVAQVTMVCGPLLRLRYFGSEDKSLEFWFNLTKDTGHELGWCEKNDIKLKPLPDILRKSPNCLIDVMKFLKTAIPFPEEMLSGDDISLVDRIKQEMKVEVCDTQHPYKLWMATIKENVGGRLKLEYETPTASDEYCWIFCTSERLLPYKFAKTSKSPWYMEPPCSIKDKYIYTAWIRCIMPYPLPYHVPEGLFQNRRKHEKHEFKVGMKLEALDPVERTTICPATVTKIFDDVYFLVTIDEKVCSSDYSESDIFGVDKRTWSCTCDHPYIFPVGYAQKHDIKMSYPKDWRQANLDWKTYLELTQSSPADESLFLKEPSSSDFECGMYLEAVDPRDPDSICAAHVTRIVDDLLWIALDSEKGRPEHIVSTKSKQIFPVGWCESNDYPLKAPWDQIIFSQKFQQPLEEPRQIPTIHPSMLEPTSPSWCPKIYFNYRCFTGSLISKGKLANLPKFVGPGPVILVMKEVLSMIVSVGYRSTSILKFLQCDTKPEPGFQLEVVKAKPKKRKKNANVYRADVAIITCGDKVAEFCKSICEKLMVCPNMFGPTQVADGDECSEDCNSTMKMKFATQFTGARRGKSTSIMPQKTRPWGGKRRRRRGRWANREKNRSDDENGYNASKLAKHDPDMCDDVDDERNNLSDVDMRNSPGKSDISDEVKNEASSNVSEDSGSSFNDVKQKERLSKSQRGSKERLNSAITKLIKRKQEDDADDESNFSDEATSEMVMPQRRPKTRKLDSNPLFWSVEDVFRYLRKTADCKEIAYIVREEEVDGLAFLLLNLPSVSQHMKLKKDAAIKLCRHVEQVKVTFFLRHMNEAELEHHDMM